MSFVPAGDTTTSVQAIQSANATVLITSTSAPAIIDQAAHELRAFADQRSSSPGRKL